MFGRLPTRQSSLDIVFYTVSVAVLSALALWSTKTVGVVLLGAIDEKIIDGSGQADPRSPLTVGKATLARSETPDSPDQPAVSQAPPQVADSRAAKTAAPARIIPTVVESGSDPAASYHNGEPGTYRTYCVRLCDGFFWPMSFSTTPDYFERDAAQCEAACGSPARLFVHPTPGGSPSTMTALNGAAYRSLKTAFRFRSTYDAQCKCRANPWEQQAQNKHRLYAAAEAARKGDKQAATVARQLAATVAAEAKVADVTRSVAARQADAELTRIARTTGAAPPVDRNARRRQANRLAAANLAEKRYLARPPSIMRLGAFESEPQPRSRRGWKPASGPQRNWNDRAFSGN